MMKYLKVTNQAGDLEVVKACLEKCLMILMNPWKILKNICNTGFLDTHTILLVQSKDYNLYKKGYI